MADFQKEHENMDGKDENMDGKDENMDRKDENMDGNVNGVLHRVVFAVRYAIDVSNRAIHLLSYLISALLYVWLLGFIILHFSHTLRSAFAPLCIIPGISSSSSAVGTLKHKTNGQSNGPITLISSRLRAKCSSS